ncbi:MAG: hypothetical protein CVT88_01635 [Candidatus Altiarchaeales archaeon HGW-Altiarchaeales-1]|nr:MAG: hypothetical protein CVT88_01635 [Candidatus Altiarchaeales archaeon HGW-Altiarchaeales-1]
MLNAVDLNEIAEGNEEHTTLLDIAMRRISLKEGAKQLNIRYGAIRGRIYRIKHRSDKSKPYSKKPGPKSRYKISEHKDLIREYRKKGLTSEEISNVLRETINVDISSITIGRFLSEEGFLRQYNRTSRQKEDTLMDIKDIIISYKTKYHHKLQNKK